MFLQYCSGGRDFRLPTTRSRVGVSFKSTRSNNKEGAFPLVVLLVVDSPYLPTQFKSRGMAKMGFIEGQNQVELPVL